MATQEQLNKALCRLCVACKEVHGILELTDIGADPKANRCEALERAILCENQVAVNCLIYMHHFDDPQIQHEFRTLGIMCANNKIRETLCAHNNYAVAKLGWSEGEIAPYYTWKTCDTRSSLANPT